MFPENRNHTKDEKSLKNNGILPVSQRNRINRLTGSDAHICLHLVSVTHISFQRSGWWSISIPHPFRSSVFALSAFIWSIIALLCVWHKQCIRLKLFSQMVTNAFVARDLWLCFLAPQTILNEKLLVFFFVSKHESYLYLKDTSNDWCHRECDFNQHLTTHIRQWYLLLDVVSSSVWISEFTFAYTIITEALFLNRILFWNISRRLFFDFTNQIRRFHTTRHAKPHSTHAFSLHEHFRLPS